MPRNDNDSRHPQPRPRELRSAEASPKEPDAAAAGVYAAAGDESLTVAATLALDQPFRFDRGLAKRLRMREVNAKEAFTVRDASGAYFRAGVKEYDAKGGYAVPYERMSRSPEP